MKTSYGVSIASTILLALAATAFAQQPPQQPQPAQAPPPPSRSLDYVEEKGFKGKVFELKHRNPDVLYNVLRPLASGFKGATMSPSRDFRTITVRDFPENIAMIEEAIKRLDVPETEAPDVELHVHVLVASNVAGPAEEYPTELSDVLKQLQATLKYKGYSLMASSIHRAKVGLGPGHGVGNKGVAESKLFSVSTPQANPILYNYNIGPLALEGSKIQMPSFSFQIRIPLIVGANQIQYENVGFDSPVTLREGERVVVGTTTMADKGLIVVVSAKILK